MRKLFLPLFVGALLCCCFVPAERSVARERHKKITDAYWIDEQGKKCRDLTMWDTVTLYIRVKRSIPGDTINLTLEDEDTGQKVTYKGIVYRKGVAEIRQCIINYDSVKTD